MARPKQSKTAGVIGVVLLAIIGGVYLGVSVFNEPEGTPSPPPPKVDLNDKYDDAWGKLATADANWQVTHILVSWEGAGVKTKKPRDKAAARKLIDEIWAKYRVNPTADNWKALQVEFNEDTGQVHNVYKSSDSLVEPFKETSKLTKVGFARVAESNYGFHLIRRER